MDATTCPDRSLLIQIRRTKRKQLGEGYSVIIERTSNPAHCPINAINDLKYKYTDASNEIPS